MERCKYQPRQKTEEIWKVTLVLQYYSVIDRVNLHDKSSAITPILKEAVDYNQFLPSPDISALKKNLVIIVSGILVENIPALHRCASGIKKAY